MSFYSKLRKWGLGFLQGKPKLRQKVRTTYWNMRRRQFVKMSAETPVNPKMVVFEAFSGRKYACTPRAIYEAMCADPRFDDWDLVWGFRGNAMERVSQEPALERARFVKRGDKGYFEAMAKAKYWVFNARVAEYIMPKKDQVYLQCWHGTPLKRLGYDVTNEDMGALNTASELAARFGMDSAKWTYLVSPSAFTSEHLASAFGLPQERRSSVVLEEGYPRNDYVALTCATPDLLAQTKARIMEELQVPKGKKLLLYAPTWRDTEYQAGLGYVQEELLDFAALHDALSDEWVILFRPHYYIANKFDFEKYGDFMVNAAALDDINDLYVIADALLTDYSSVFFDYACTGRPLYFYWPDFDEYANDIRGFYFDPRTLPGPKCETEEQLVDAIKDFDNWFDTYGEEYAAFRQKFAPKDDGHAAQRYIEKVFLA